MKRLKHMAGKLERVNVFGIPCIYGDMRIDRSAVPEGIYMYEVAGDDEGGEEPIKIRSETIYHFIGTLLCEEPLPLGEDGTLYVENGDFVWNPPSDDEVHIGHYNIFDGPTGMDPYRDSSQLNTSKKENDDRGADETTFGEGNLELNDGKAARVDAIHNAVFEMCKVLAENPDLEWDMRYISDIAGHAADTLCLMGKKVRYPAVVTGEDGKQYIEEYHNGRG